jgi:hypothetical protein
LTTQREPAGCLADGVPGSCDAGDSRLFALIRLALTVATTAVLAGPVAAAGLVSLLSYLGPFPVF